MYAYILLYGLDSCPVSHRQLTSLNHVVVSCGRKIFNVYTSEIAAECLKMFGVSDVAEALATGKDRLVKALFTRYSRLLNQLYNRLLYNRFNRFDNRLYRVNGYKRCLLNNSVVCEICAILWPPHVIGQAI